MNNDQLIQQLGWTDSLQKRRERKKNYLRMVHAFARINKKIKEYNLKNGKLRNIFDSLNQYDIKFPKRNKNKEHLEELRDGRKAKNRFKIKMKDGTIIHVDGEAAYFWNINEVSEKMSKRWEDRKKDKKLMRDLRKKISKGTSEGMKRYWSTRKGQK